VQELELSVGLGSLDALLAFLACSFSGGTDVDQPLERCLARLATDAWKQADILMVTDGEIKPPDAALLKRIRAANAELGLEVHALIVATQARARHPRSRALAAAPPAVRCAALGEHAAPRQQPVRRSHRHCPPHKAPRTQVSEPMKELCSTGAAHLFKSWNAAGGESWQY
jgi:hypothetical protein